MGDENTPPKSSVQTDLFCSCGYNLYAQVVHVDERLGIPVCRCPECGRYHALNTLQPAQSPWLARLGLLVLAIYSLLVLWGMVMVHLGLGAMQYGFVASIEESARSTRSGWYHGSSMLEQLWWQWLPEIVFILCAITGFIYMMLATAFFWHWRRDAYWRLLIVPVLSGGIIFWIGVEDHDRSFLHDMAIWRVAGAVVAVMFGMGLGVRWGRKTVRGLLMLLLPPRVRQSLAFLWLVDGKPAPGLETPAANPAPARQQPPSPVE